MHPDGFMMNQKGGTAFQEFGERRADYRFTSNRLRGSEENTRDFNILTLGDSFTFGLLLNEEQTFIHHLQATTDSIFADSIRFMNAAVGGTGLADWPGWLENFGAATQPDLVILFLNYKDLDRALSKNLFIYDTETDALIASRRWKPRAFFTKLGQKGWYRWLQAHSHLMNITVKLLWRFVYFDDVTHNFDPKKTEVPIAELQDYSLDSDYSIHLGYKLIGKLEQWCSINSCDFVLATTGFFTDSANIDHSSRFYHTLKADSSIHMKDISNCMNEHTSGDYDLITIPGDGHPNETGARYIADCTAKWLMPYLKTR